jgi:hypothetical protein
MIRNVVVSTLAMVAMYSLVIFWKITDVVSKKLLLKIVKKESSGYLDLDNLIRFLFLIIIVVLVWTPIGYVLTIIFD